MTPGPTMAPTTAAATTATPTLAPTTTSPTSSPTTTSPTVALPTEDRSQEDDLPPEVYSYGTYPEHSVLPLQRCEGDCDRTTDVSAWVLCIFFYCTAR